MAVCVWEQSGACMSVCVRCSVRTRWKASNDTGFRLFSRGRPTLFSRLIYARSSAAVKGPALVRMTLDIIPTTKPPSPHEPWPTSRVEIVGFLAHPSSRRPQPCQACKGGAPSLTQGAFELRWNVALNGTSKHRVMLGWVKKASLPDRDTPL